MAKLRAFRLAAAIVPFIPLWLAYPGARLIGGIIWAFGGQLRRRVERNLRHIPALAGDSVALQRAARGVFESMVLNYLDFLRGPHLTDKQVLAGWTTEGEEYFNEVMAEGRGLILVSAHFGNFEYGASRLGAVGYKMTTPAERLRPEELFTWFCKTRTHHNMTLFPADSRETLREMIGALKRNEMVLVAADRHIVGSSIETPFFGEPARLPTSPFALALRTGTPVAATFSWRVDRRRSRGVVIPLDVQPELAGSGDSGSAATRTHTEEAIARAVRLYVAELERLIAAHPEQWVSTLATIWEADEEVDDAGALHARHVAEHVAEHKEHTKQAGSEFGQTQEQSTGQSTRQSAIQSA